MATSPAPDAAAPPGMCPGVAVLGGGGANGDGDGDGSGGKDGSGGNGSGDGENGGGDGKGSGACGKGGAGGCSNCGHKVAAGDPVDVVSGTVFTVPKTDLALPGFFTFDFRRSYATTRREVDVGLGFGWTHSLAWSLEERGREVHVVSGDGRRAELPRPREPRTAATVGGWSIFRGEDFYAVRPGNEFEHYFEPADPGSKRYRLRFISYRGRGSIALQYERGRLARAVDTAGRVILFHHAQGGRISSISVPDLRGQSIVFARYAHDERGDLVAAADADGHTTYFAYDDEHRLVRLEYPSGLVFHYVYDARGRCVETWGEYPGRKDPALADGLSEVLADGRTQAKGIYHCRLEFGDRGEYTEVTDSARLRRFFTGPDGAVAKAVNGLGGVISRAFDEHGRVVGQIDANDGVWEYTYDDRDKLVREVDPEGGAVTLTRDPAGNEIEVVDPAGGVTSIGRDQHGEITWVKDPAGGLLQLRLGPRGLVVEAVDARGGRHLYEWDDHGNCVARTHPSGARFEFQYDWWGRVVREIDPLGNEVRLAYNSAGEATAITDPLGRTWSYQFDGMGNVVAETEPDGVTMRREYGGLNWLCRVRHPDGSELSARYDRDGRPQYFVNERGERHEFKHNGEGRITWERDFHGHAYAFGYDAGGRLIWSDDGDGKRERTLSAAGRLLKEQAPDGSVRAYAYNARGELTRAFSGSEGFAWARDPLGRVIRETLHVGGERYEIESQVTAAGDRTAYRTSLGLELHVGRDPMGRVAEIWGGGERILGITRNLLSQPVRRDLPGGGAVVDSYDAARRLRLRKVLGPGEATQSVGEPARRGGVVPGAVEQQYDYAPANEVLKVTSSDRKDVEYEYDVRRRLRKVKRPEGVEQYSADAAGNHFEVGGDAPPRVYGKGNQLLRLGDVEYRYDDRGFLVEKRRPSPGAKGLEVTRYAWNAWGLLQRVDQPDGTAIELKYDPFARRLAKLTLRDGEVVEKHHYVWDLLAMVHDVDISGERSRVHTYLFEDNSDSIPLGQREGNQWLHYVNDINGTPEKVIDGAGRIVSRLERAPFGRTRVAPGSTVTAPFRFPGQLEDPETGLHYNRYRYYDPEAGRYISPDPIGLDGGWNLYAYGPNPVGWSDPMGWVHKMTVKGPKKFLTHINEEGHTDSPNTYLSGKQETTPCPEELNNRANCHTEQKFAQDLIDYNNGKKNGLKGQTFELSGQLPPCPTCHNALRSAAEQTGANITYSWEQPKGKNNTVTYSGSSAPTFSSDKGGVAKQLEAAGYNDRTKNPDTTWGYSSPGSAGDKYRELKNQKLAAGY